MKDLFGHDKVEEAINHKNIIKLIEVVYDVKARNGTWCRLPYQGHPKGCPNFPKCPSREYDFRLLKAWIHWYAVIEEFNLWDHTALMKLLHPNWSDRQCRNLLYWQGGVKNRLKSKAKTFYECEHGDILLEIPEANGINVFETMAKVGINIERHPNIVRKIILIGKTKR